jgi:hypothetical protein
VFELVRVAATLPISTPLGAGRAQACHSKESTNAEQTYYNQQAHVRGEQQAGRGVGT